MNKKILKRIKEWFIGEPQPNYLRGSREEPKFFNAQHEKAMKAQINGKKEQTK